jgi:ketosteroid isomerase-like protein
MTTNAAPDPAHSAHPIALARKVYRAYIERGRTAIEQIIAEDFHFTSPRDNRIDRAAYFARCWPRSENATDFAFVYLTSQGEQVFVTYEGHSKNGYPFRNTEILTVREGRVVEIEVYFGWSLPHEAPAGGFIDTTTDHAP